MPVPPPSAPRAPGRLTTRDRDGPLTKREEASLGGFPDPLPCRATGRTLRRSVWKRFGEETPLAFASFLPFGLPLSR